MSSRPAWYKREFQDSQGHTEEHNNKRSPVPKEDRGDYIYVTEEKLHPDNQPRMELTEAELRFRTQSQHTHSPANSARSRVILSLL